MWKALFWWTHRELWPSSATLWSFFSVSAHRLAARSHFRLPALISSFSYSCRQMFFTAPINLQNTTCQNLEMVETKTRANGGRILDVLHSEGKENSFKWMLINVFGHKNICEHHDFSMFLWPEARNEALISTEINQQLSQCVLMHLFDIFYNLCMGKKET